MSFIQNNRILSIIVTAVIVIIIIILISVLSLCNGNQVITTEPPVTTTSANSSTTTINPTTAIDTSSTITTTASSTGIVTTTAAITISFNASGGTPVVAESIAPGSTINISAKTSTYANHNFLGWYTSANGQGTEVTDTTIFNASQTVYAYWELMPRITITFETNGGDAIAPISFYSNTGQNQTIDQVPVKGSYTFGGWFANSGLTGEAVTGTIFVSENLILYAKWAVDTSHITYEEYQDPYSGISGYYVSAISDSYSGTELILPAEIDGNPIIGINASAADSLGIMKATKITFEEGYLVVGANSFNRWSQQDTLVEVVLPTTIKFIGNNAFYNQTALASVNISECVNLLGIDNFAFSRTALTAVALPESLLNLGQGVFENISSLSSFSFPSATAYKAIPPRLFMSTPNLTSITLPGTINSLGYWAFSQSGIETITIPASVTNIGEEAFADSALESITFENEDNIVYLSNNIFENTPYLGSYSGEYLVIHNLLVRYLGDGANVVIPEGVIAISEGAFEGETIQNITFNANLREIRAYAFHETVFTNAISLPNTIRLIGRYAFNYATFPSQSLTMPSGLVSLGDSAFEAAYHLTEVVFQAGTPLKKIGDRAFHVVSDFAAITLHEGLETIGDEAFVGNPLSAITIPSSVTTIGYEAFRGCSNLSMVTFVDANNLSDIDTNPFVSTPWLNNHPNDYVVVGKYLLKYKGASSAIVIPASVKAIVQKAIQTLPVAVTSLDLGSVEIIYDYGIIGYFPDLTTVHLPASLKYLGNSSIASSASSITSITWDAGFNPTFVSNVAFGMHAPYDKCQEVTADNLVIFGDYLYLGTLATGTITVPEGIKIIGPYSFRDAQVTEVILPNSLEVIQERAFYNSGITTLTIPANVHTINTQAFGSTLSLQTVTFEDSSALENVTAIPFYNSAAIQNYLTPEGYFVIGDVFLGIGTVIDSIVVPANVNVYAAIIDMPAKVNNLVIPANVMVVIEATYPGDSVVTLDFSGYFPNNEYRLAFFGMFYDPEIVIPSLATFVMPSNSLPRPHFIKVITSVLEEEELQACYQSHCPEIVAPE